MWRADQDAPAFYGSSYLTPTPSAWATQVLSVAITQAITGHMLRAFQRCVPILDSDTDSSWTPGRSLLGYGAGRYRNRRNPVDLSGMSAALVRIDDTCTIGQSAGNDDATDAADDSSDAPSDDDSSAGSWDEEEDTWYFGENVTEASASDAMPTAASLGITTDLTAPEGDAADDDDDADWDSEDEESSDDHPAPRQARHHQRTHDGKRNDSSSSSSRQQTR